MKDHQPYFVVDKVDCAWDEAQGAADGRILARDESRVERREYGIVRAIENPQDFLRPLMPCGA